MTLERGKAYCIVPSCPTKQAAPFCLRFFCSSAFELQQAPPTRRVQCPGAWDVDTAVSSPDPNPHHSPNPNPRPHHPSPSPNPNPSPNPTQGGPRSAPNWSANPQFWLTIQPPPGIRSMSHVRITLVLEPP